MAPATNKRHAARRPRRWQERPEPRGLRAIEILDDYDGDEQPTVDAAGAAFRRVAATLAGYSPRMVRADGMDEREIFVTPFNGAYGFAGVVITINGSPPRGTFLVPADAIPAASWSVIVHEYAGRVKRLTPTSHGQAYAVVTAYLRALGYDRCGVPASAS